MLLLATQLQEAEEKNNFYSSNGKEANDEPNDSDSDDEKDKEKAAPISDKRLATLKAQLSSKDKKLAALKQVLLHTCVVLHKCVV